MASPSKRRFYGLICLVLIAAGTALWLTSAPSFSWKPQWKYVQVFEGGNVISCVDKAHINGKNGDREDFFIVHSYDYGKKAFGEQIRVPIRKGKAKEAEYLGGSKYYIWLKTPELTVVDMRSRKILRWNELSHKIRKANPGVFRSIDTTLHRYSDFIRLECTGPDDVWHTINLVSLRTQKDTYGHEDVTGIYFQPRLKLDSDAHRWGTCGSAFFRPGDADPPRFELKPYRNDDCHHRSLIQSEWIPRENTERPTIIDTVDGKVRTYEYVICEWPADRVTPLTDRIFTDGQAIAVKGDQLVFVYRKEHTRDWKLAYFNYKTKRFHEKAVPKTVMQNGATERDFNFAFSPDDRYVFFYNGDDVPVRMRL